MYVYKAQIFYIKKIVCVRERKRQAAERRARRLLGAAELARDTWLASQQGSRIGDGAQGEKGRAWRGSGAKAMFAGYASPGGS